MAESGKIRNQILILFCSIITQPQSDVYGGEAVTRTIRAPRGTQLTCKNWLIEAPYRMLQNNLDPQVAGDPENLIV